jgi:hypothetical protein
MILLIGNYSLDRQQSMQRFATMMLEGLAAAGVPAQLIQPQPSLGKIRWAGRFVGKWLAYIDKFILFRPRLRKKLRHCGRTSFTSRSFQCHVCRVDSRVPSW